MPKKIVKIRVLFWFFKALFQKYYSIVLISFIASLLVFLLLKAVFPFVSPYLNPKVERIAIVGNYSPTNLPLNIQSLLSLGLTTITLDGSPSSGLAQSWQSSQDGKIYEFTLKKNIQWHDQKEFNAYDINYHLNDAIIIPKTDFVLEVRLQEPYVPLPVIMAKPIFKKGLVGVGNYKVHSLRLTGDTIKYLHLYSLNKSQPAKIFHFYESEEKAFTAFKLGEVDVIDQVTDASPLKGWNNIEISEKTLLNRYVALVFNNKDELFKNRELRQGLNYAINNISGEKPTGPISPLSWAYYSKVKNYQYNSSAADKLLNNSPIASSSTQITISTFQNLLSVANKISEDWKKFGINTNIKIENEIPSDYQLLLLTQDIPPDPDQYLLWHSVQTATNLSKIANPKIDKLLEDGRVVKNEKDRLDIYVDFQRFLAEESAVAFLYYPKVYTITRKH